MQEPFPSGPWQPLSLSPFPSSALLEGCGLGLVPRDSEVISKTPMAKQPARVGAWGGQFLTNPPAAGLCRHSQLRGVNQFLTKSHIVQPGYRAGLVLVLISPCNWTPPSRTCRQRSGQAKCAWSPGDKNQRASKNNTFQANRWPKNSLTNRQPGKGLAW